MPDTVLGNGETLAKDIDILLHEYKVLWGSRQVTGR